MRTPLLASLLLLACAPPNSARPYPKIEPPAGQAAAATSDGAVHYFDRAVDLEPFLVGKKKLEGVAFVSGNLAVFTIGASATKFAGDVSASLKAGRKTSLSGDPGLRLARAASQGCHFCVSLDPAALLRLSILSDADARADKARVKKVDSAARRFVPGEQAAERLRRRYLGSLPPADAAQPGDLSAGSEPARDDKPLRGGKSAARDALAGQPPPA